MPETFRSVPQMLLRRVGKTPDREAYLRPVPDGWEALSWREVGDRVRAIACGLRALGLEDEERASILASTRLEWILADLGILSAGGATTTIYPSTTTPDALFILQDSDTRFLFAENPEQAERIARVLRVTVEGVWLDLMTMREPYALEEAKATVWACVAAFFPRHFGPEGRLRGA